MKAYSYDDNFIYIGEIDCQYDQLDKKYLLPANATFIEPIEYDVDLEDLKFDISKQQWIKQDIILNGKYFLKSNGQQFETISKKDIVLYTTKEIILDIGDEVYFNDTLNNWIYSNKGDRTLLRELTETKQLKSNKIKDEYSQVQFGLVKQNGSVFKVALSGESWLDFERQVLKASINGVADFIVINEAGVLKILKDIPFSVLQPLYKNLCNVSVGNFTIKNQLLYQVNIAQDSSAVENIVISFPDIQTFTIG